MPYANNNGINIHYHVEGEGRPLVLMHGFTLSLESWQEFGYVEALKDEYRLVLIDARGHGLSDKPHDPKLYEMDLRINDIVSVLDKLEISKAHYLGYSMGGRMGYGIGLYAPQRFHSIIIGGSGPYQSKSKGPNPMISLLEKGNQAWVTWLESRGWPLTPEYKSRHLLTNDIQALIASQNAARYGFDASLPTMTMPCMVYSGDADNAHSSAEEGVKHMPNSTFISLPGLSHGEALYQIDKTLPHIKSFLAKVHGS
jgi:pimeloyl-ACP methyl ester carboxylesterase